MQIWLRPPNTAETAETPVGETGVSQEDDRVQGKTRLTVLSGKRHGHRCRSASRPRGAIGTLLTGGAQRCASATSDQNRDRPVPDLESAMVPTSLVMQRSRVRSRAASRRCGGSFAKQVAGNVEKGKAPTLLWEHVEIRLDENLDGLFAGINLDTNRRVAEIDLVASSVCSANDGVGLYRLASQGSPAISDHLRPVQAPKAEQLWSGTVRAVGST